MYECPPAAKPIGTYVSGLTYRQFCALPPTVLIYTSMKMRLKDGTIIIKL